MEQPKDPQKELEISIHELEERVDRLRSLYEQYFMGYEKVEPSVQRKDVDRRFANLRKLQIRNTAIRFRFNVVTQRFNTYAMYWTRVCRQIEEGSYKRHIVKAERRFADRANTRAQRGAESDLAIDVDLADFEESDIDQLLAEANAAAEAYGGAGGRGSDTEAPARMASDLPEELAGAIVPLKVPVVPPSARAAPAIPPLVPEPPKPAAPPPRGAISLAAPLGRPMTPNEVPRMPRQVALPPGARAVVVRRSRQDSEEVDAPPSRPNEPPAPPPSTRTLGKQPPLQRFVPTPQVPITPNAVPRGQGPVVQKPPAAAPARPPLPSGAQASPPTPASPLRPGPAARPPPPLPSQGQPKKPTG